MNSITSSITIREFRNELADAVSRASYGHERVQITGNGKPAAVLIGPDDFELLEQLEMQRDVAEYRRAKAADEGERVLYEIVDQSLIVTVVRMAHRREACQ